MRHAVAVGLGSALLVSLAGACGGGESMPSAQPTSARTTAETGQRPPGGPAPPELQGTWLSHYAGAPARLYIRRDAYAVSAGVAVQGDVVVDGHVIAFFNSNGGSCPPDPLDDLGRYRWTISHEQLRLKLLGKDPCSGRASFFTNAAFEKAE
jgi:hypothetical protein